MVLGKLYFLSNCLWWLWTSPRVLIKHFWSGMTPQQVKSFAFGVLFYLIAGLFLCIEHCSTHPTSFVSITLKIIWTELFLFLFNFSVTYSFLFPISCCKIACFQSLLAWGSWNCEFCLLYPIEMKLCPSDGSQWSRENKLCDSPFFRRDLMALSCGGSCPLCLAKLLCLAKGGSAKVTLYPGGYALSF